MPISPPHNSPIFARTVTTHTTGLCREKSLIRVYAHSSACGEWDRSYYTPISIQRTLQIFLFLHHSCFPSVPFIHLVLGVSILC
ncbi:hypothetical protein L1887_32404 [Cichorium endivia]|nr:hypothetical protein L1887_32404 [Cichorium endivia]